ncbi:MAG TPA: protein kinase [Ktedonobacteraceae bacterium]|nr:protein kinase [Ktedonobacteraceae bacterium]
MIQRNPRVIGGIYQTGPVITSGPMLTTYTGYNRNNGDVVGLHVIEIPPMVEEAEAMRLLQPLEQRKQALSEHVIHVYDWGMDGSRVFIATDPPRGITLRHVLDNENVEMSRVLNLTRQMARGLIVLQAQSLTGIDMRPQLITIDRLGETDRAQLDDIGLRQLLRQFGYTQGLQPGDIGSLDPRYAAPEQIQQGLIGSWSDVYQLGLLIFEMVTGRLPFVGRTATETGILQVSSPAPRMAQFTQTAPQALQDLLDRVLSKDPSQRLPNAAAMLDALNAIPTLSASQRTPLSSPDLLLTPTYGIPSFPTQPKGQTGEMAKMPLEQGDIALQGTVINEDSTVFRPGNTPVEATGIIEMEEDVLAYLTLEHEGHESRRFPIKNSYVVVGRLDPKRDIRPEVDLTNVDPRMTVSRQHARIRYEKTFFYIEDLKSHNKTRLGELTLTPLKAELLQHGDVVQFGSVRMVFRVPGMKDLPVLK